jgi:hypothetical protein
VLANEVVIPEKEYVKLFRSLITLLALVTTPERREVRADKSFAMLLTEEDIAFVEFCTE